MSQARNDAEDLDAEELDEEFAEDEPQDDAVERKATKADRKTKKDDKRPSRGRKPAARWDNSPAQFHQIGLILINGAARGPPLRPSTNTLERF